MNIAFLVNRFPVLSETFILNQITGLLDLGHNIEIFAKVNPRESTSHADIKKYNLMEKVHYFENIPSNRKICIKKTLGILARYLYKDPIRLIKSLYIYKKYKFFKNGHECYYSIPFIGKKFDILQCHFGPNGNIGAYLKQSGFKYKIVTMFHGYDIRLIEKMGKEIYNVLKNHGDLFLAISPYNYKNIIDMGFDDNKTHYHPVGIDINKYTFKNYTSPNLNKKIITITTVARLVEEKGLQYAIKAISKIVEEYPGYNIQYRIIGDGPLKNNLKEMVVQLQLKNHVEFSGEMEQDDVIRNLMDSDIFLLSSVAEALPVVLMEAQAIGLPVVATGVGSISEIVIDKVSGFIVPAGDMEAIKKKIAYLIEHAEIWPEMGRAGRANVESKYDVNILNKKLEKIYEGLIENNT